MVIVGKADEINKDRLIYPVKGPGGVGKRVAFKTLGCRLNQFETDALVSDFDRAGYEIVDFRDQADIVVVNTCTVTNQSDQKSRNSIHQAIRKNKNALVVVTGCMANNYKEKLEAEDQITYVVENHQKSSILSLVNAHYQGEIVSPRALEGDVFEYRPVDRSLHTRSAIKIQDGCDNFCTYCIIPKVRGRAVSRPLPGIIENVRETLNNGFKELVITGVNIGRYDWEGKTFEDVLEAILAIPGDFRLRISSLEPEGFGDRFYELFKNPKLVPHLHLCLQSGSDKVLLRMRRMYDLNAFETMVGRFRLLYPDFNFTTDLIVGFPGETEEDFQASLDVVRRLGFGHVHTFKYSVRHGTRAERMEDQLPGAIKTERSARIRQLSEDNRESYLSRFIGQEETVLIETIDEKQIAQGYGEHYVPVHFPGKELQKNTFHRVTLIGVRGRGEKAFLVGEAKL